MVINKTIKILLFGIMFLSLFQLVQAVPRIEPYVNDFANLLSEEEETSLNLLLDQIEINTTYEIAVVTVQNTEGQDRIEYANKIGDENGVGKIDKDNGIVLLYSIENEHGGAIATGRGSESIFNDAKVGRIGRDAKQYCDKQLYYDCFNFIINELNKEIVSQSGNSTVLEGEGDEDGGLGIGLFIILAIVLIFIIAVTSDSDGSGSSSSGTFSTGRGSSGGGSFGGGSFGGGGGGF